MRYRRACVAEGCAYSDAMRGSLGTIRSCTGRVRLAGLAAVAGLALSAAACSSDDGAKDAVDPAPSTTTAEALATGAALQAIQSLTGRIAPAPGESIELGTCPMGEMKSLVEQGPPEVREVEIGTATTYQYVYQSELAGEHPFLTCMLESSDDVSDVGLSVGQVVPDFKEDTIRVLSNFELTFEPEYSYLGGTMLQYCATPLQDDAPFCEVDWFDGNVWVGVFITSENRSVAAADEWLRALLPSVLDATVASSPTVQAI